MSRSSSSSSNSSVGCIVLIVFLLIGLVVGIVKNSHVDTVTGTVTDKGVVLQNRSSKYLIYTDQETFEDTDEMFQGKFNSSDVYGAIKVGHTYSFRVVGWRMPFWSMYRNIISYQEVQKQ